MSTQREEAIVELGLSTTRIKAEMGRFASDFRSSISHVAKEFAGAFTAGGIIVGIERVLDKMEELKNRSANLEISTDFLQGMEHIASKDAVGGVETFNKAISELSKNLGEAKSGSEEAVKKFEKWGFTIADIKSLNAEEAFYKIADQIKATHDPALRTAEAFELMGKTGKNLVGVLAEGSEELKKLSDNVSKVSDDEIQILAQLKADLKDSSNFLTTIFAKALAFPGLVAGGLGRLSAGDDDFSGGKAKGRADYEAAKAVAHEKSLARMDAEDEVEANAEKVAEEALKFQRGQTDKQIAEKQKVADAETKLYEKSMALTSRATEYKIKKDKEAADLKRQEIERFMPTLDKLRHSSKFGKDARHIKTLDREIERDFLKGDTQGAQSKIGQREKLYDSLADRGVVAQRSNRDKLENITERTAKAVEKIAAFLPAKK